MTAMQLTVNLAARSSDFFSGTAHSSIAQYSHKNSIQIFDFRDEVKIMVWALNRTKL